MNAQTNIAAEASDPLKHQTLIGALAAALAEVEGAIKDAQNPHLKNKYADLASVVTAIRPVARHGIWFRQVTKPDDAGARVETFYIHESGEMSAGEMFVPAGKRDPQGFGSALTYCRRYALQTAFGIAPEDDDGEAATASYKADQYAPREKAPPAKQSGAMPDAEWSQLVQLVEVSRSDTIAMCKHYGVNSLRELDGTQYANAIAAMKKKLAKLAKAESDAKALAEKQAEPAQPSRAAANGFGEILDDEIPF